MPLPFPFTTYGANRSSNTPSDDDCFTYCYGGDWVQGKVGNYGMHFNGDASTGYVSINNPTSLELSEGTIAGWIKRGELDGRTTLISLGQAGSAANNDANWMLEIDANGTDDKLYMNVGNGTYHAYCKTAATIADTDWHHIAGSFTNNARDFVLYIDGVSQSLDPDVTTNAGAGGFTPGIDGTQEANLGVSVRTTIYGRYLTGSMDEVAVWDVALTSSQISALYNSGSGARADSVTPPVSGRGDWVTGKVDDYALQFAASDTNRVTLPLGATTGSYSGQSGSISAWINRTAVGSYPMIFSTAKSGGITDYGYFAIWSNTDSYQNKLVWRQYINTSTQVNTQYSAGTIPADSNWYHVVLTSDGTNTKFYINGTASAATTTGGNDGAWFADCDEMDTALIGNLDYNGVLFEYPFPGKIDEVAVWNDALTGVDVLELYNDSAGAKSNSITTRDARWTEGKVDDFALKFTGGSLASTGPHVVLPIAAAGNAAQGSISFWFKLRAIDTTGGLAEAIIGIGNGATGTQYLEVYVQNQGSGTTTEIGVVGSSEMGVALITAKTVTAGDWFHMVITGDSSEAKLYLNGSLVATDSSVSGWLDQLNLKDSFILGGFSYSSPVPCFDGEVDELAAYNVVLSLADAALLAGGAKANTVSSSALVSYYDMEDGTGTTLTDRTANGYNGTLTNFGTETSASLISYYDMENGVGSTLTDRTSNGFDGTLESMDVGSTGSLLLYYDFEIADSNPVSGNFPTSTTVYDGDTVAWKSPTMHTGTMTNMSVADWGDWQQGKIGKYALQFDGTNDYVDAGTGLTSLYADKLTVSCWVYGTFAGNSVIAAQWDYGATKRGWEMRILGAGGIDTVEIGATEGGAWSGDYLAAKSTTTISDNTWYHIVGVYDCSTAPATPKIYINGVAETLSANTSQGGAFDIGGTIVGGPPELTIGAYLNSAADVENLAGKIDELSIWSGSLSQANITSLAAGEKANAITASVPTSATGSWTTGKIGDYSIGLNQDGVDRTDPCEGISAASASAFPLGATVSSEGDGPAFSVAAWIYPVKLAGTLNVTDANWRVIVGRDGAGTSGYEGWKISMDGASGKDGMISWAPGGYPSSGFNGRARSSTGAIEINKWHLVVGVWDPSDSGNEVKMHIYKEGASSVLVQTSYSSLTFTSGPATDNLSIGCYDYPEGPNLIFGWMGKIDDVGIWNVALDSGATDSLWNSGTGSAATTVSSSNLGFKLDNG